MGEVEELFGFKEKFVDFNGVLVGAWKKEEMFGWSVRDVRVLEVEKELSYVVRC